MNIEISEKSMQISTNWAEARLYCFSMGDTWRLPTDIELLKLRQTNTHNLSGWYWATSDVMPYIPRCVYINGIFGIEDANAILDDVKITENLFVRAVRDVN